MIHADGLDIETEATPIEDENFRRRLFSSPDARWYTTQAELEHLVAAAPLVEIHLPTSETDERIDPT